MNVEGRWESLNIDYKEYYRVGSDLPVFFKYFILFNHLYF